jgi:hypothetical protein
MKNEIIERLRNLDNRVMLETHEAAEIRELTEQLFVEEFELTEDEANDIIILKHTTVLDDLDTMQMENSEPDYWAEQIEILDNLQNIYFVLFDYSVYYLDYADGEFKNLFDYK